MKKIGPETCTQPYVKHIQALKEGEREMREGHSLLYKDHLSSALTSTALVFSQVI